MTTTMSQKQTLKHEVTALTLAGLYFGCWIGTLMALKELLLAEYQIAFHGLSVVLIGVLVLAKVVLILEHVPLAAWVRSRPAWVDVVLRTLMYSFGVLVVLLIEKAFEGRREHGGLSPSLMSVFKHADVHHVWINTICLSGALLGYNILAVIRQHLGEGGLLRLFLTPTPEVTSPKHTD